MKVLFFGALAGLMVAVAIIVFNPGQPVTTFLVVGGGVTAALIAALLGWFPE